MKDTSKVRDHVSAVLRGPDGKLKQVIGEQKTETKVVGYVISELGPHVPLVDSVFVQTEIQKRKEARARGDYVIADCIRDELLAVGICIEEHKNGDVTWCYDPKNLAVLRTSQDFWMRRRAK